MTKEVIEMEFRLLDTAEKKEYQNELLEILSANDTAFVPPLSQRTKTTQTDLKGTGEKGSIRPYFDGMMQQNVLAMFHEGQLIGFVSYIDNLTSEVIGPENLPNIYLSTLVVSPGARGMGATRKAYAHLFLERYPDRNVFTRTWSTNAAHIKILNGFGFEELKRIPNDRGEGIDTVYYCKKREC